MAIFNFRGICAHNARIVTFSSHAVSTYAHQWKDMPIPMALVVNLGLYDLGIDNRPHLHTNPTTHNKRFSYLNNNCIS